MSLQQLVASWEISHQLDSEEECAKLIKTSFVDLGLKNGILIANPVPKEQEADADKVKKNIEEALKEAEYQKAK